MADDEEVYGDEMVEEQLEDDDHKGEGEAAEGDDVGSPSYLLATLCIVNLFRMTVSLRPA
jgi:hypothetical protein